MKIMSTSRVITLISACLALTSLSALALTCPTNLMQDHNGYWLSHDKPGWKSNRNTKHGVELQAQQFAGVVFSPKHQRLACVYRASDGQFIALVSNVNAKISIDKSGKDDAGKAAAWRYSKTHKDYACGQPDVKQISNCRFKLD